MSENYFVWLFFRLISYAITTWSFTMYYFLMLMTGYWFVFYKLQTKIYEFIPEKEEDDRVYYYYKFCFWFVSIGMLYYFMYMIYDQSSIDVFFIDWERRRLYNKDDLKNESNNNQGGKFDEIEKMEQQSKGSIWRTLLIANEFNEMFGSRYINIEYVFMIFAVIMEGYKYQNLAVTTPFLERDNGILQTNYMLKFFLSSALMMVIGGVYYGKVKLDYNSYPKKHNLKDSNLIGELCRSLFSLKY